MPNEPAPSEITDTASDEPAATLSEVVPQPDWSTPTAEPPLSPPDEAATIEAAAGGTNDSWWSAPVQPPSPPEQTFVSAPASFTAPAETEMPVAFLPSVSEVPDTSASSEIPVPEGSAFFCGDTSFFSLNWALHTIAAQKLTGTLRAFWNHEPVELLARDGRVLFVTTRDPELYCSEAPITLVNVPAENTAAAREAQRQTGRPLFLTLAQEGLIVREPALQLVQHYGQKLFAQLWTASRVRFMFEQGDQLPDYAADFPAEEDVDYWALSTLRFVQSHDLGSHGKYDPASIPAYTRDGFDRVQRLRLTVAEAQFASQFNGARSVAQIAKNLRLDQNFARLTLFRFQALEIVECWPPGVAVKQEKRGVFGRIFGD